MVAWWWLVVAFVAGGNLGLLVCSLLVAADRDDEPRLREADLEDFERWVEAARRHRGIA